MELRVRFELTVSLRFRLTKPAQSTAMRPQQGYSVLEISFRMRALKNLRAFRLVQRFSNCL